MNTVVINDNYEFQLAEFPQFIESGLRIVSVDLASVRSAFSNINKIEVYSDGELTATYTSFDSFENIIYMGDDTLIITLKKTDLEEQVRRLTQQVNPTINLDFMIIDERQEYEIDKVHKAVQQDIFNGIDVILSDGTVEHFELTLEDQSNISSLYLTAITSQGLITSLPYHSRGHLCREYPIEDIIRIYVAMQKFIALKTTIANFTIQRIRNTFDANEFRNIYYGMEFNAEETEQINEVLSSTNATIDAMLELLSNGGGNG